ncbi:DUF192 domain-containing protein [Thioalkalivibrio sp.]|uniref:DUF192 domain-containing protein n=1 Tax=Thioalkalivibrio sp. TaxID=2093813 RepID=UPI0012D69C17|nr:DUF192 domain-containing protein [Thioalkalivibrio sp.]TVP81374.1 MAG: DUF192 domain-containing protein [Thioalkalivibrio sp.]
MSRRGWISAGAAVLLLWFAIGGARAELPTEELKVADQILTVEIAATPQAMARGLMYREYMPEAHGMLFIWPGDQVVAMWMKNTLIPLSVAFIDRDFRVLNIADMEPRSLRTHASHGPARYALEVNQGWFGRHGVETGTRIDDLERLLTDLAGGRH